MRMTAMPNRVVDEDGDKNDLVSNYLLVSREEQSRDSAFLRLPMVILRALATAVPPTRSLPIPLPTMSAFFLNTLGSVPPRIQVVIGCYVAVEVAFCFAFHYWLVPRSNRLRRYPQAPIYRDYPSISQRHRLLVRILHRLQQRRSNGRGHHHDEPSNVTGEQLRDIVTTFLLKWFVRGGDPRRHRDNNHSGTSSSNDGGALRPAAQIADAGTSLSSKSSRSRREAFMLSSSSSSGDSSIISPPPSVIAESDASSVDSGSHLSCRNGVSIVVDKDNDNDSGPTNSGSECASHMDHGRPGPEPWTLNGIDAHRANDLFSWAFFGTSVAALENDDDNNHVSAQVRNELHKMHAVIREHVGLQFDDGTGEGGSDHVPNYTARQMTLEPVNALHRPLLVYAGIAVLQRIANLLLRCVGFRRVVSTSTGLVGWYRPSTRAPSQNRSEICPPPLLFFHGIAPAGHVFYVPMVLRGLLAAPEDQGRAVYIFENPHISCSLSNVLWDRGTALTEPETVQGVHEILQATLGHEKANATPLSLVGHSFGSVPLTWMLHSHFRSRIVSMLLIDPVTILLSEPDVMINFLYSTDVSKIRMVASSELGIQVYLRRHFAWYNAELWLSDVPPHVAMGVALSEHDEILNAPKVRDELLHHNIPHLYWRHVGHAHCVTSPSKWRQLRDLMDAAVKQVQPQLQDGLTSAAQHKKDD